MLRRPVAWIVAVVLFAEAVGFAALNWFLGEVVHRQRMSLAGLDPNVMATSSKIGGLVVGLYFALCGLVALLVAVRGRRPAGLGRILLISAAVVHGLLAAFAWGLVGWKAFLFMVVVLALIVLLLMTYDRGEASRGAAGAADGPRAAGPGGAAPGDTRPGGVAPEDTRPGGAAPGDKGGPGGGEPAPVPPAAPEPGSGAA
ncbi:hypothetical protein [Streptomyces sp. NPDC046985]|uniref:hypothetical protein n=1 Tax=Streptomyces sp. NPDC046985 TaxID=3155377 RepID=UPI0033C9386C